MAISTYAANKILDAILNNTSFQVAQAWIALHSGDPGDDGANELSGNGYGRKAGTFSAPSSGATSNSGALTFGPATGSNWAEAGYFGVWDAETDGNFLGGGAVSVARTVLVGEYAEWAIGELDVTCGAQWGNDFRDSILNALLRNTALVVAQAYMSLHSGDPGGTGANELSGNNYGRVAMSYGAAATKSASSDAVTNSPTASGDWAQATYGGLWTLPTGGSFIWGDQLTTARTVLSGKFLRAAIAAWQVTVT